jgi:hypothetical protein
MTSVFVVQHLHVLPGAIDDTKLVGVYSSHSMALAAVARLCLELGFRDHPRVVEPGDEDDQGFHVSEYQLDLDHWCDGYVTV